MFDEDPKNRREIRQLKKMMRRSPLLFARLAECYLRMGEQKRAEKILAKGIETFPEYITGYQILAESYLYRCLYSVAEDYIQTGLALEPQHLGLLALLKKIKELTEEEKALNELTQSIAITDPLLNQDHGPQEELASTPTVEHTVELSAVDDLLTIDLKSELPEQTTADAQVDTASAKTAEPESPTLGDIRTLKRIIQSEVSEPSPEESSEANEAESDIPQYKDKISKRSAPPRRKLATKTLGELYATQQKYDEAIEIYESLIETDPANHVYQERLAELKNRREATFSMPMETENE